MSLVVFLRGALFLLDISHSFEKGEMGFSPDQDTDQTQKVYLTVSTVCVCVCIMCAIARVIQQNFDVIDVTGLDPLFHQHQINKQRT